MVLQMKTKLIAGGYSLCGDELLKITIAAKPRGYLGDELADLLREQGIECEFSDPDFLVLMLSPETEEAMLRRLEGILLRIPARKPVESVPPVFRAMERVMTIREAAFAPSEKISVAECVGRVLAASTVGCPPAVPIVICGERLDDHALTCFSYYGIKNCTVVKE